MKIVGLLLVTNKLWNSDRFINEVISDASKLGYQIFWRIFSNSADFLKIHFISESSFSANLALSKPNISGSL